MDTGIRSAAANRFNVLPKNRFQCLIQDLLYTDCILLNLPAMIGRAIISDLQKKPAFLLHPAKLIIAKQNNRHLG